MSGEVQDHPCDGGPEAPLRYEPPVLEEVDDVAALTNGTSFDDTADRKIYYF